MAEQNNTTEQKQAENATDLHFDTLSEKDLLIMDYRILGLKYSSIIDKMAEIGYREITEDVIKGCFRVGGRLYDIYPIYKKKVLEERVNEGNELMRAHFVNAVGKLVEAVKGGNIIAIKELIERVAGKVPNVNFNFDKERIDKEAERLKEALK